MFVCGAKPSEHGDGSRDRLVQYGRKHLRHFRFFLAEDVFKALARDAHHDLLSIEETLADVSDCIIIILESEGAFAELGAFTVRNNLARIVLAINDKKHEHSQSFLSLGPLAKLDRYSTFRPVIYGDLQRILSNMPDVEDRLAKIQRMNNKRLDLSTFDAITDAPPKHRVLFLHDLIKLFGPLRKKDLLGLITLLYGKPFDTVSLELGLLQALGFAHMVGEYYHPCTSLGEYFLAYEGLNLMATRSLAINHYHKHARHRCEALLDASQPTHTSHSRR